MRSGPRRSAERSAYVRRWWAAGGVGLVAASVVTALALMTGIPGPGRPDPAGTSTRPPSPSTSRTDTDARPTEQHGPVAVPVYYVGDTPAGPRLYREFRPLSGDPLASAVSAAVGRDGDGRPRYPLDPDYRVAVAAAWLHGGTSAPRGTSSTSTSPAIPSATCTAVAGCRSRRPGSPSSSSSAPPRRPPARAASGAVPPRRQAHRPGARRPDVRAARRRVRPAVLSRVSLTDPSEGPIVDNDEPFVVRGVGNSFEGTIVVTDPALGGHLHRGRRRPTVAGSGGPALPLRRHLRPR